MKLKEITVGMLRKALDVYVEVAYCGETPRVRPPEFVSDETCSVGAFLDRFEDESTGGEEGRLRRYILRLGNLKYPFMKFVLQEELIQDEFIFLVDTHDDMFDIPSIDFEELRRIREFNREIKARVEQEWADMGLPTLTSLRRILSGPGRPGSGVFRDLAGKRILVVDDDPVMGETLAELLAAEGFEVERLFDGIEAVREADPTRHDLIIMDNDMKVMDGLEACRILKEDPARRHIPVMIASARNLDISVINRADAYLVKPFHKDILFSFIGHLLRKAPRDETL